MMTSMKLTLKRVSRVYPRSWTTSRRWSPRPSLRSNPKTRLNHWSNFSQRTRNLRKMTHPITIAIVMRGLLHLMTWVKMKASHPIHQVLLRRRVTLLMRYQAVRWQGLLSLMRRKMSMALMGMRVELIVGMIKVWGASKLSRKMICKCNIPSQWCEYLKSSFTISQHF